MKKRGFDWRYWLFAAVVAYVVVGPVFGLVLMSLLGLVYYFVFYGPSMEPGGGGPRHRVSFEIDDAVFGVEGHLELTVHVTDAARFELAAEGVDEAPAQRVEAVCRLALRSALGQAKPEALADQLRLADELGTALSARGLTADTLNLKIEECYTSELKELLNPTPVVLEVPMRPASAPFVRAEAPVAPIEPPAAPEAPAPASSAASGMTDFDRVLAELQGRSTPEAEGR